MTKEEAQTLATRTYGYEAKVAEFETPIDFTQRNGCYGSGRFGLSLRGQTIFKHVHLVHWYAADSFEALFELAKEHPPKTDE